MLEPPCDHPQTPTLVRVIFGTTAPKNFTWADFFEKLDKMKQNLTDSNLKVLHEANEMLCNAMNDRCQLETSASLIQQLRVNMTRVIRYCVDYDGNLSQIVC